MNDKNDNEQIKSESNSAITNFDKHVDECLSMVMHCDEIQEIARIVKEINKTKADLLTKQE